MVVSKKWICALNFRHILHRNKVTISQDLVLGGGNKSLAKLLSICSSFSFVRGGVGGVEGKRPGPECEWRVLSDRESREVLY